MRLGPYSENYLRCVDCETLCAANLPDPQGDEHDLYTGNTIGLFEEESGPPRLEDRARAELSERCPSWLRALMRRKLPPGRVLELGCGSGAFVALLRAAGFDATGLEPSAGLAEDARRRFDIPVLAEAVGLPEDRHWESGCCGHGRGMGRRRNPGETIRNCLALLKSDGIFLVQAPRYPEALPFRARQEASNPCLNPLWPNRQVYVFSRSSIRLFFHRLGLPHVELETDMPGGYDMLLAASRTTLADFSSEQIASVLATRPSRRIALALLDTESRRRHLQHRIDQLLANFSSDPMVRTLWRLKHSYVTRAMRMLGLWGWLDFGEYRPTDRPESTDQAGDPSDDHYRGQQRGD